MARFAVCVSALAVAAALGAAAAGADEVPYYTAPPFLVGPGTQGVEQVLSVAAGGWGGKHLTFTYQWQRCDPTGGACAPIPGATTTTNLWSDEYVEQPVDAGSRLRVQVTATNALGSTSALSNLSAVLPPLGSTGTAAGEGTIEHFEVDSPALGHRQPVSVYLPPGYRRGGRVGYPVLYLLHGTPGTPASYENSLAIGLAMDELIRTHAIQPLVLVIPNGNPNGVPDPATDPAWLDGPLGEWETFVTRDLVGWVDSCFAVNTTQAGRGIGGLSDGGYGALNMALHHPDEFRLAESWSGYEHADPTQRSLAGATPATLLYDSPADELSRVAGALRRDRVLLWLYIGQQDAAYAENMQFAESLVARRIAHTFLVVPGSHLPSVYRANLPAALEAASKSLLPTRNTHRPTPTTTCPQPAR